VGVDPQAKPLLLYDGDCGFCRAWIARWSRATGGRVEFAPYQDGATRYPPHPDIPAADLARAVHLIEPDGHVTSGAEAVFRALAWAPGHGWPLWLYRRVPGFARMSEWGYAAVARNRGALGRVTGWIWGRHPVPPGESLTAWIFLRLLALVYLAAFVSVWTQVSGLIGSGGILPAREFLQSVAARYGGVGYWLAPTLGWLNGSDAFLQLLCAAGTAFSILLALGAAPIACLATLWVLYLSLAVLGQDFFWFQWDGLLLEVGFLAIFLAPWRRWTWRAGATSPSRGAIWLMRWLLFRLMFSSAAVKLLSGDPSWHRLAALRYHFETQPLPPWTAWYSHHLPPALLQFATAAVLIVEGVAPFFIFAPRRIRFAACGAMALLQLLIVATGNYGFFNALSLALCFLLLDDGVWPRRWLGRTGIPAAASAAPETAPRSGGGWPQWVLRPVVVALFAISLVPFLQSLQRPTAWLGPVKAAYEAAAPLRTFNHYGLFAVMTTERPEIIVEGSADGALWLPYEFRYKPGDVFRAPGFVAPHQPRLDWQMWFAALSDYRQQPWFLSFCERLLQGSRPVLGLLRDNPFPEAPPRFLRAVVTVYRFTDPPTRRRTGAWWRREARGLYCPVLTLVQGRLAAVSIESR
jgi:predicted DCC family thiol-disulfide oxidoreductase YuxK